MRVVLVSASGYFTVPVILRTAGKRSTAKMNMFDWGVTVALGSMLATFSLSATVPLAVGVAGVATLVTMQFIISWAHVRWPGFRKVVTASPTLLYYLEDFLDEELLAERISRDDIRSKARTAGYASMDEVHAVVLEPDAELSVLGRRGEKASTSLLQDMGPPPG